MFISKNLMVGGEATEMASVSETLERFRSWTEPPQRTGENPFRLACTLAEPATLAEIESVVPNDSSSLRDLIDLWSTCREARLFEDVNYGQWGLVFLSPTESAKRSALEREQRPDDFSSIDIVVGEFLGDQELLVLSPSEGNGRNVLVALPLDERAEWYPAAASLGEFLDRYMDHQGEKYWERE